MIIIKYHLGNGKQVYEKWEETATARLSPDVQALPHAKPAPTGGHV